MRVTHPRLAPRRSSTRASTWWGKAWVRAVDETAYDAADLRAARSLARSGAVGQVAVEPGGFVAGVVVGDEAWTVSGALPTLDPTAIAGLVETIAAESGRIVSLLAGDLPHLLVEHAEEAGVELLPYGSELSSTCTCAAWADPCPHALAAFSQVAWLIDRDPLVLLHLRGLPRDDLLARLHATRPGDDSSPDLDLDIAHDAAVRAAEMLDHGDDLDACSSRAVPSATGPAGLECGGRNDRAAG